ncbi:MAG: hypothetical protein DME22_18010 [Verrucomicrobia bacterium]|nr:MAG: hypothetical protein DME22_18010 [Verrucomicrobiota bacterium]
MNLITGLGCRLFIFLALIELSIRSSPLCALGFRIPNQDAEATARGNAFVATANNPSALYYNPAGITLLEGQNAQLGAHVISVNSHFKAATGGTEADTDFEIQPVPQFYYVYSPMNYPLAFGLGIYAPIAAWRVNSTLSIAAGPTVNFSTAMLRRGIGIVPGDEFRFRGNGFAYGAKVGLLWQPHSKWSLGVSYFSPTTVNYRGNSTAKPIVSQKSGTSAELDFPQFIMGGISFRPTTNWNVEVGVDWTDWDTLDTVTFKGTAFGDVPFPLNWKSSYLAHFGVTRYLSNGYWVSAGYFFSQNSTSDRDFNPIVPDTDLHVASLGFGHKGESWNWALSGQVIAGPARQINNGNSADGSYQFFNQAVNFSIGYHF